MDPVLLLQDLIASRNVTGVILASLMFAFTAWMLIDCLQNQRQCGWLWLIVMTGGLGAFLYFYTFHWESDLMHGLVWTNLAERRRIKELKRRVHYLDKAADHEELGDSYFRFRKFAEAEACYRTALERDPKSLSASVQLGYTLLAQNRADQAWEFLRTAYETRPEYGEDELLWQCARCQAMRGEYDEAVRLYDYLLTRHSYCEAQVEFAQVLLRTEQPERGVELLHEIIDDFEHSPSYVQRRERRWVRKARALLRNATAPRATADV